MPYLAYYFLLTPIFNVRKFNLQPFLLRHFDPPHLSKYIVIVCVIFLSRCLSSGWWSSDDLILLLCWAWLMMDNKKVCWDTPFRNFLMRSKLSIRVPGTVQASLQSRLSLRKPIPLQRSLPSTCSLTDVTHNATFTLLIFLITLTLAAFVYLPCGDWTWGLLHDSEGLHHSPVFLVIAWYFLKAF